jgi:hypothetical protein
MDDERAIIPFEGPPKDSKYCEGCPLWESMCENGDNCSIYGDVYCDDGDNAGLHLRPDECKLDEVAYRAVMAVRG